MWGLVGGLLGSAVMLALVARPTQQKLTDRAALLAEQLQGRGSDFELYLTTQGEQVREDIAYVGDKRAREVAAATVEQTLGTVYGLTPSRVVRAQELYQRLRRQV